MWGAVVVSWTLKSAWDVTGSRLWQADDVVGGVPAEAPLPKRRGSTPQGSVAARVKCEDGA